MKILYAEDDPTAVEYISRGLSEHGYQVDVAQDSDEGIQRAFRGRYDLLVLDVMLPGADGFQVLRCLREKGINTPAIFLSARGEVGDRVTGLDLGADDYLRKPFAFSELLARIRAVTRRRIEDSDGTIRQVADLIIDERNREVRRQNIVIDVTQKEYALLDYLMANEACPLSRSMIIEKVWGYDFDGFSNVIDVHINHLRRKIDRDFSANLIHTVKGVGYVLEYRADTAGAVDPTDE